MTLKDAKALRDEIKAEGVYAMVPLGHGPDGYFARITTTTGHVDFTNKLDWYDYKFEMYKHREQALIAYQNSMRRIAPRSPLDILIDRACGLEG